MGAKAGRSVLVRLTLEQRAELDELAAREGMPIQQFIELRVFGEVRPRRDPRAPRRPDAQLALEIEEEAQIKQSA